jgi:uncharacterized protein
MHMNVQVIYDDEQRYDFVLRNAWIPNYNLRCVGDMTVATSPVGGWLLLTADEIHKLSSVAVPINLYRRLEREYLILTNDNTLTYFSAYRRWSAPHFRDPVHHIILTTLRCNLSCSYCHAAVVPANAGPEFDLTPEVGDAILSIALNSSAGHQSFEFQGGESLLNRGTLRYLIPRIIAAYCADGKEVSISIQTNATLLNDDWMTFFREHKVKVGTSLDGPEAVHDRERYTNSRRGTHKVVARAIEKYQLPTLPTITGMSAPHWRAIVDDQLMRGVELVSFQNAYPINNARTNWSTIGISMDEYLAVYQEVVTYLRSLWRDSYYPLERRLYLALKKLVLRRDVDFADFGNPCGMVHSQIAYHTNGDIYTCDEGRDFPEFRLGNVMVESYDHIVFRWPDARAKVTVNSR